MENTVIINDIIMYRDIHQRRSQVFRTLGKLSACENQ